VSEIDRKRIAAVKVLEGMSYYFDGVTWHAPRHRTGGRPGSLCS